jgi:hypothetical protein
MKQRFDKAKYGQRWQTETVNSLIKRLLGSALRARTYWSQRREIILRVITHNVMIVASGWVFYRAGPQDFEDLLPCAVDPPAPVVEVDRAPRGQVFGQHPPGDAASDDREEAVEDRAEVDRAGPPAGLGVRHQRLDRPPLLVGQVGGVTLAFPDRPDCEK